MVELSVSTNVGEITQGLSRMAQQQVPFATSLAINRVAEFAQSALKSNMAVVFDRPKPFTLNSVFVKRSNKSNLTAVVFHSNAVSRYILPEIEGGLRGPKPFEQSVNTGGLLVPSGLVRQDSYGNVPRSIIQRMQQGAGKGGSGIFVIPEGAKSHLKPGVYERLATKVRTKGKGKNRRLEQQKGAIRPLFYMTQRAIYQPRYDMQGVVGRTVESQFGSQFAAAMDYALSTAK